MNLEKEINQYLQTNNTYCVYVKRKDINKRFMNAGYTLKEINEAVLMLKDSNVINHSIKLGWYSVKTKKEAQRCFER